MKLNNFLIIIIKEIRCIENNYDPIWDEREFPTTDLLRVTLVSVKES